MSLNPSAIGSGAQRRVSIVDDDAPVREALKNLMRSAQFSVETFASAEEFLGSAHLTDTECLILDLYLPGMNGFELQEHLNAERRNIPIIFITAHADEPSRQRALKSGAIDMLGKPVRRDALFKAIQSAIQS
jgi:FixJ family two-component response regulator